MKKVQIISIIILTLIMFSCNAQENVKVAEKKLTTNKIEVIDFHSTKRCMTCNAIEANTKLALEKYFAKELEAGLITFQSINIDEEKNTAITEKFEAAGTSLFLNVIIDGKEEQINLTDMAFLKGRKKNEIGIELKTIIEKKLKLI